MSLQEVDKLSKALKDDEFRKLFFDYAKEISDPENKQVRRDNVLLLGTITVATIIPVRISMLHIN